MSVMTCSLIVAIISLVFPLLTRYITRLVTDNNIVNGYPEILKIGLIMIVMIAIKTISSYYYDYRGHSLGAMMERDMRSELFDHYQKLSFSFYDEHNTGKLMSRITNDLLSLAELYHHGPEDYIINSIKFIGTFFILWNINSKMTMGIFFILPFMALFSFYFNKRLRVAYEDNWNRIGDINAQVEDSLSGIRVIKSFVNEEVEKKKFAYGNNRFLESRKTIYRNEAYLYNGMDTFLQLITVTVILFGAASILITRLDVADFLTFLLYIGNISEPIQNLNHITRQFQEGVTSFGRFMDILEIQPDIKDSDHSFILPQVQGNIDFKDVSFRYQEKYEFVFENVNLNIKAGEYIALVGSSGIGKTTICSLIPRFYEASSGEILLDGVNIKNIKLDFLRRQIGVVQQDVYLFSGTVMDNIRYGNNNASKEDIIQASKDANAHEFIMELPDGYNTDIGQRGVKLSGGQKQRISIARVFLKNPRILIFDEATSSLDNESEKVVKDSLEKLARNRTTLVIAHRLSTIRKAQRIIVLTESGIAEQGTHNELINANGSYAHLYNMQNQ